MGIKEDMNKIMPALGLATEPLPLWWTSDFILSSPVGTPVEQEKWIVGEFNCSCVGISKCLPAFCNKDNPNASWNDIPAADKDEAEDGQQDGRCCMQDLGRFQEVVLGCSRSISSFRGLSLPFCSQYFHPIFSKFLSSDAHCLVIFVEIVSTITFHNA